MKETVNSKQSLGTVKSLIDQMQAEFGYLEITIIPRRKTRTNQQRKALQVYCREMAKRLNESGSSFDKFIRHIAECGLSVSWTEDNFKEAFKMYGGGMFPEKVTGETTNGIPIISTKNLDTKETIDLYELTNERMSFLYGVGMQWPSKED